MYSPEVECANHKAFLQQTFDHSQYHRIVVAATKYRVWVRNYGSSSGISSGVSSARDGIVKLYAGSAMRTCGVHSQAV
jgi:hypothetical protein